MPASQSPPAAAVAQVLLIDVRDLKVKSTGNNLVGIRMVDEFSGDVLEGTSKSNTYVHLTESIMDLIYVRYVAHGHMPKHIVADSEPSLVASAALLGTHHAAI